MLIADYCAGGSSICPGIDNCNMCIIFVHTDPHCESSDYKLIIAANRDESFHRPSKQAEFLPENSDVLCGIDLAFGEKDGGTWFGVNKTGKFGFVTNYLTSNSHGDLMESGISRGSVVKNYLLSNVSVNSYIESSLAKTKIRPFNFIGGQVLSSSNEIELFYYSNFDETSPYRLDPGSYCLAGTKLGVQWKKIVLGSEIFDETLKNSNKDPTALSNILLDDLLSNKTILYPDQLVIDQSGVRLSEDFLKYYCSIMVDGIPDYGTRTQTVVLVDKNNHLYFTENNIAHSDSGFASWHKNVYDFPLRLNA